MAQRQLLAPTARGKLAGPAGRRLARHLARAPLLRSAQGVGRGVWTGPAGTENGATPGAGPPATIRARCGQRVWTGPAGRRLAQPLARAPLLRSAQGVGRGHRRLCGGEMALIRAAHATRPPLPRIPAADAFTQYKQLQQQP
eukprot:358783-Chlamydomonas_euryale.AAC.3